MSGNEPPRDVIELIEGKIVDYCATNTNGLPGNKTREVLQGQSDQDVAFVFNLMLQQGRLTAFKDAHGMLFYKAINPETVQKFKNMSPQEMLVYQLIEQSNNMGIWSRDIRTRSNLQQGQLLKILKSFEQRQLIKSVKPVSAKNKKVFMLFNVEPSREITGGAWYQDQEFDSEFIQILNTQCYNYIKSHGTATVNHLDAYIRKSQISRVELRPDDIQCIVDTLLYDGKIEEAPGIGAVRYQTSNLTIPTNGYTAVPCGVCPVFNKCEDGGVISPLNCIYITNWTAEW